LANDLDSDESDRCRADSTARALPFFVLALPAGSIGDIFDGRKLILQTEVWMLGMAVVLAATIITHTTTSALSEEGWSLERFLVKTDWGSKGKPFVQWNTSTFIGRSQASY